MPVIATWRGGYEIALEDGRTHRVTVDLPPEEGGRSAGTTAGELTVMALAGSLATAFLHHARHAGVELEGLTVGLEGENGGSPGPLRRVRGTLRARTRAATADVERVLGEAVHASAVGAMFARSGISIEVRAVTESPAVVARR